MINEEISKEAKEQFMYTGIAPTVVRISPDDYGKLLKELQPRYMIPSQGGVEKLPGMTVEVDRELTPGKFILF